MSDAERITLRYFTQFQCVGGACRENCCTGLKVQLSQENHRRLEERSAKLPQLKVLFDETVKLEPEAERGVEGLDREARVLGDRDAVQQAVDRHTVDAAQAAKQQPGLLRNAGMPAQRRSKLQQDAHQSNLTPGIGTGRDS